MRASVEIVGLLEMLDARGGARTSSISLEDFGRDFGKIMAVVKAAELLDFVDTPKQDVVLDEPGRKFLARGHPRAQV